MDKVVKECFGNYMLKDCKGHYNCKEIGCFEKTNTDKGTCNCKYKAYCHIPRQHVQTQFKNEYAERNEDCPFYPMFEEERV